MVVLIDPPRWPAHGRLWSHLVSDSSVEELHAFARAAGLPPRAFAGDHYDVPEERYAALVAAGAHPVPGKELLSRLVASGLRVPQRRGEHVLASTQTPHWLATVGPHRLDVLVSPHAVPAEATVATRLLVVDDAGRVLLTRREEAARWGLPRIAPAPTGEHGPDRPRRVGYQRLRVMGAGPAGLPAPGPWSYLVLLAADPSVRDARVAARSDLAPVRWVDADEVAAVLAGRTWWPLVEHVLRGGRR